jgi:membrane-bound lytic murein transglycosylase A
MFNRYMVSLLTGGLSIASASADYMQQQGFSYNPNPYSEQAATNQESPIDYVPVYDNNGRFIENIPVYSNAPNPVRPETTPPVQQNELPPNTWLTSHVQREPRMTENTFNNQNQGCSLGSTLVSFNENCILRDSRTRDALISQIQYLNRQNPGDRVATQGVNVQNAQLMNTVQSLLGWVEGESMLPLSQQFDIVNLSKYRGEHAHFTGYYTPVISASKTPSAEYRYPIYRKPSGYAQMLSREDISRGALRGKGLELAWVNDPIGLFYVHVQGSGVIQYQNGELKALHFAGSNNKKFASIAQYMKRMGYLSSDLSRRAITAWLQQNPHKLDEVLNSNPRFIYFSESDDVSKTASGTKIIPGHTAAVDTSFIPFGSVLLAEVPDIDTNGKVIGSQWRLLFPQDRGSAIRGNARLDVYTGTGEIARKWANSLTGKQRAYLLLKKPDAPVFQTASSQY